MVERIMKGTKKYRIYLALALALLVTGLVVPNYVLGWPTNRLDNTKTGARPVCISCHSYNSGYLTIESIRGNVPVSNVVTVNPGGNFNVNFRSQGLGYGKFTVAGAVYVPDTSKWTLTEQAVGQTPWFIAEQTTINGAVPQSPIMWSTSFPQDDNPNGQKGVTPDAGALSTPYVDLNGLPHDELFTVKVNVAAGVTNGTYYLKVWGIGTTSAGVLGYNEQILQVNVASDVTAPTAPTSVTFGATTASSITVQWSGATDAGGINGYEIYRGKVNGGPYEYVGYSTTTSFIDTELLANTTYYYKIATVDNAGNKSTSLSPQGTKITANTARTDAAVPSTVTGTRAFINPADSTKKSIKITWNADKEDDITGYAVYRSTSESGTYVTASPLITTETQNTIDGTNKTVFYTVYYIDTAVRYGTTYYYKVKAFDIAGKESELPVLAASAQPAVDQGTSDPHGDYRNKSGMCQNCHSTHSSRGKELILKSAITEACYTCHDGSQSKYNVKSQFDPIANPSHHKIPEGRYYCDACHNPHYKSTNNPRLLSVVSKEDNLLKTSADKNYFCWACHGENSDLPNPFGRDHKTAFLTSKHNGVTPKSTNTQITCLNCHNSHGARDYPILVSSNSANFCILCHKDNSFTRFQVLKDDGTNLTGVTTRNFSNDYLNTSHEDHFYGRNTCTTCHEPHGSKDNRYMLLQPYNDIYGTDPAENGTVHGRVYWDNDKQADMLCFRCHDEQYYVGVGGNSNQTIGSRFGNGNAKNYHTHVTNLQVSCRTCHDPHSGMSDFNNATNRTLNNTHYVNFDWPKAVGVLVYTTHEANRLAFIKVPDANGNEAGFSCALKCHQYDHWDTGMGAYKSYLRTNNSPSVKCAACHDYDKFDTNSRHPILWDDPRENKVECTTCHLEDHTLHTRTNPYGLRSKVVTDFVYNGSPVHQETELDKTFDPVTGVEVPAYGQYCWQCHGLPGVQSRTLLGDKYTLFTGKPHSLLQREGTDNPYGEGLDSPCLTCHTHHNSTNVRLLRTLIDAVAIDAATDKGKINACLACHDGSPGWANIAAKYNAASSAGHFIKSDPTKKLLCTECHTPHGTTNLKYMLDEDKYETGVTWPKNKNNNPDTFSVKDFCITCHPYSTTTQSVYYDTYHTLKIGEIEIKPLPNTVNDHKAGGRNCEVCHDPHKPWPPTGGDDGCYDCHSRPNGEATDIKSLMGLASQPGSGLPSHHTITDADTINNTCMTRCHKEHPHSPRSDHLKTVADATYKERATCLGCHDHDSDITKRAPYTIDSHLYNNKPHDYTKPLTTYMDDSYVLGNCDKCHTPHGSNFDPLLRKRKDQLCVGCHDGVTTDKNGAVIKDIKTMYAKSGHSYSDYPGAKLYCDECHVPHGSSSDKYLRDKYAPKQNITLNGVTRSFPTNLTGGSYNQRTFCIVCHLEYKENAGVEVVRYVYYSSETSPGGLTKIRSVPKVGDNGVTIIEHTEGNAKVCTDCHNPHDPEPVGSDKDCFICHGTTGYAYRIEPLTGHKDPALTGPYTWPTVAKASYHPILDANTQTTNTCMNMCHQKHVHNPRSNVLVDRRSTAGDVTPPNASVSYTAYARSGNTVELEIIASNSTDAVGYMVYKNINSTWAKYGVVNSNATYPATVRFFDGGVKEGIQQSYRVVAFDRVGNGKNVATAVTTSVTPVPASDTTAPDIPTNLTAAVSSTTGLTCNSIVLSWTPAKDNYITRKYYIYRSTYENNSSYPYVQIGTAGDITANSGGRVSFVDGGVKAQTTYYYKIRAVDTQGNVSGETAPVSAKTEALWAQEQPGDYWVNSVANRVYYQLLRASDNTPTNIYMNSTNMKVKIKTPHDYFGTITTGKIGLYMYSADTVAANTYTKEITSFVPERLPAGDTFTWTVPMPSPPYDLCALYSTKVTIQDGSKTFKIGDSTVVAPTSKNFVIYKDSGYTQASQTYTPGSTVYFTASSDNPNPANSVTGTIKLYDSTGTPVGTAGSMVLTDYDTTNGYWKKSYVLPASGLTDDTWYTLGVKAIVSRTRRTGTSTLTVLDVYKQILIRTLDTTAPGQPGAITVGAVTPNTVDLSWTASSGDVVGYNVYYSLHGLNTYTLNGSTTNTNFTVSGLTNTNNYDFKVVAFDAAANLSTDRLNTTGTTTSALPVDNTPPDPVPTTNNNIRTETDSASTITINWSYPQYPFPNPQGVAGFSVYRSTDGTNFYKVGSTTATSFTDTGLFSNTLYYYKVKAYDRSGNVSDALGSVSRRTKRSGDDSVEGALCLYCHDGTRTNPLGYNVTSLIGTAYLYSKHNIDMALITFKDGSVYEGNCLKCHVAHGSDYDKLLRQANDNELCFLCHTSASNDSKYSGRSYYEATAHGETYATGYYSSTPRYWPGGDGVPAKTPADAGKCSNCHAPHGRFVPGTETTTKEYIKASTWRGNSTNLNALCYTCHSDANAYGEYEGETVYKATYHGNPLFNGKMKLDSTYGSGECTNCHDPHGTPYQGMLRYPFNESGTNMNKLCMTCHDRSDILVDTGLFAGSRIYLQSAHGQKAKWLQGINDVYGVVYNKTEFLTGVCTNCHNSHGAKTTGGSIIGKMLVVENGPDNDICNKCHEYSTIKATRTSYPGNTVFQSSEHHIDTNAVWPGGRYYDEPQSVDNTGKCINCHDPHGTARTDSKGILVNMQGAAFDEEEELCYTCHDGESGHATHNMEQFRGNLSGHMPWVTFKAHSFNEDLNNVQRHVECQDCHNVHYVETTDGQSTLSGRLSKALKGTWGVRMANINQAIDPDWPAPPTPSYASYKTSLTVAPIATSGYNYELDGVTGQVYRVPSSDPGFKEYMLCFKCHSTYAPNSGGKRVIGYMNPRNGSSHGWDPGRTTNTFQNPALNTNYATLFKASGLGVEFQTKSRTQLTCSDCHGNSNGTGPKGPHGSNMDYMLLRDYKTTAFCTECHNAAGTGTRGPHSTGQHNATTIYLRNSAGTRPPDEAEIVNNFTQRFGTNTCRYCHFAGHYMYSTQWVSVHGENAAWRIDPAAKGNTPAYRGMNGYFIGRIDWGAGMTTGTCYAKDEDGYYCGQASGGGGTKHNSATGY